MPLHLWDDGSNVVSAESEEDASAALFDVTEEEPGDDACWRQIPDEQPFTLIDMDEDGHPEQTQLARQWAAEGRGMVACSDY